MDSTSERLTQVLRRLDGRVDWEQRDRSAGMRVGLDPIRRLCLALGSPEQRLRVVHLAGSKGKGSTAAWIAAGLAARGERVGRYGSPHVERINERVVIEGEPIADEPWAGALERTLAAEDARGASEEPATWFDLVTAAGFLALAEAGLTWAVIEVGLGGRLDSTNVVSPEMTVITTIELEHVEVLGDTREKIAAEKAGILKPGVPAMCGLHPEDPAAQVIAARAGAVGAVLLYLAQVERSGFPEFNRDLAFEVLGRLDAQRRAAGEPVPHVEDADLVEPRLPARLERFGPLAGVPIVLDGAHTPDSLEGVLDVLGQDSSLPGRPSVVFGTARAKDADAMLKLLAGRADRVFCTSLDPTLYFSSEELVAKASELGLEALNASDPWTAVLAGVEESAGRWLLVTGSLHLAGALRPELVRHLQRNRC